MATLLSEEESCPSSLQLLPGAKQVIEKVQEECWQEIILHLASGAHKVNSVGGNNCTICRLPADEIEQFAQQLEAILRGQKQRVFFEPNEPSFEINIERSRRQGIKVEAWIDAGNASTGIYTWDAAGIRFFTTDEKLANFINDLRTEF
ncbi:MAG: hypothetical protein K2X77_26190 [Candidatus Obscuribacterales bacterium]|jgi:hypothetical protein|nr:hypothetical protein [Candidatus Obscuribacterales bacterium]